jgi:hypothetical protein
MIYHYCEIHECNVRILFIETIQIKFVFIVVRQEKLSDKNTSSNQWVQINNICVPYLIKSDQSRLLPYQVLLDYDLFLIDLYHLIFGTR